MKTDEIYKDTHGEEIKEGNHLRIDGPFPDDFYGVVKNDPDFGIIVEKFNGGFEPLTEALKNNNLEIYTEIII